MTPLPPPAEGDGRKVKALSPVAIGVGLSIAATAFVVLRWVLG